MLSNAEYKALKALEEDLPLVNDPFKVLAQKAGLSRDEFYDAVQSLKNRGIIRRMGVVLRHQKAGVRGNIMAAFKVAPHKLKETGSGLAQSPAVSHCYARKPGANWPYNLYAMVHAATRQEAELKVKELCLKLGINEFLLLPTIEELKKTSFVFTSPFA